MKYCPKCKAEYRDGFNTCSDCNIELVNTIPYEQDKKATSRNKKLLIVAVINGALLFFAINFLGEGLKEPLKTIIPDINMSSPMNMSYFVAIPIGIFGAVVVSMISFWFVDKNDYIFFSLISSIVGFCIDMFLKSGGLLGFLMCLNNSPKYLIFMTFAFSMIYTIAFITMLISLKVMDRMFLKRNVL